MRLSLAPWSLLALLSAAPASAAESQPLGSDRMVLPLAGLRLDVPGEADHPGYQLSGRWALTADGFASVDVIDELRHGQLASRTFVTIDRMDEDDCLQVLDALALGNGWRAQTAELWGAPVAVRGGLWEGGDGLGKKPALAVCATRGDRRRMLAIRVQAEPQLNKGALLARGKASLMLAELWRAYLQQQTQTSTPAWAADVEGSGIPAARSVKLAQSGLGVTIPDDGFVWQIPVGQDTFVRRAPADPELAVDVFVRPDEGCVQSFYELGAAGAKSSSAKNLPAGWMVGGKAFVGGSEATVACRVARGGTLTVAVHRQPGISDWKELQPLLDALGRAAGNDLAPGTAVEVEWHGSWLDATIVEARGGTYFVDFDDRDDNWNEWVERARVRRR
ncbi:MAG: hypothetical protein U1F43_05095 [Myxococcota bacterium]